MHRPRRSGAGVNKSLSTDFVWPDNFGRQENRTTQSIPDQRLENVHSKAGSSSSSISIQRKRLELEKEKKKQELERQKIEIENNMKLLDLEHELQEAELKASSEKSQRGSRKTTSNAEFPELPRANSTSTIAEWLKDNEKIGANIGNSDELPENDMKVLCQTLINALSSNPSANTEKFIARQTIDKDFPYFDGKPEEWPLFYCQLNNIISLGNYSQAEIMTKLQKCLKGEAKVSVAGMLLTAENVELVINSLKMRFGRPDQIIEVLISKIKVIPFIKEHNLDKLIQFSNEVNNLVATMRTLRSVGHMNNPQLLKDLLTKLPDILKLKWGEEVAMKRGNVDLQDFNEWVTGMAVAASYIGGGDKFVEKSGYKTPYPKTKLERVLSTIDTSQNNIQCRYCDGKNHEGDCPKMMADDVDTRWKVITEKKLCFCCLKKNHQKTRCKSKKPCDVDNCKRLHHPLLHKYTARQYENAPQCSSNSTSNVYTTKHDTKNVLLRMLPVKLYGPDANLRILALCDEASTVTLIDSKIINKLKLYGKKQELCLQWTGDITSNQKNSECLDMQISNNGPKTKLYTLKNVHTVENLSLPTQTVDLSNLIQYPHLKDILLEDISNEKPMLLIGQDNINLILTEQVRSGPEEAPVASKCKLGWALHGPNIANDTNLRSSCLLHVCSMSSFSEDRIETMLKESFSIDNFGIEKSKILMTSDEKRALEIMKQTARRTENRYEIGLLWKDENPVLPASKATALQRLRCVERKCKKDIRIGEEYSKRIQSYIEKGYAEKLSPEEASVEGPTTWYLPHFPVVNVKKKKLRLVFDAAAKSDGKSLNDYLLAGPDLLSPLVAILWKFRQRKIAFCGDIREMFHQVQVRKADRCAQRFLWRDLESHKSPDIYQMKVMTFGATCSPVCAQFIKNLNAQKMAKDPEILKAITTKFYVDDYLDSKDTTEMALQTINEVRKVLKLGGFDLVSWITNCKDIRKLLSSDLQSTSKNLDEENLHRVLGMWWDSDNDTFLFKLNENKKLIEEKPTKRNILKSVMALFDPLGLITCFTIRGKILMQDIWRCGSGWDEEIPENLKGFWIKWVQDLKEITKITIPRCYSKYIPEAKKIELHVFCDSSEKAYSVVAYLRVISCSKIDVSLVTAKSRVSPLKPLSIPRLELQASVLASRLASTLLEELEIPIHQTFFWTDSKCVLNWIRNDGRKFKQFVAHRIGEIQELTKKEDWRWVPTALNAADLATRTSDSQTVIFPKMWYQGPPFLKETEEKWPREEEEKSEIMEQNEIKKEFKYIFTTITNQKANLLPDSRRFSRWSRLIRATAWVKRYIDKLKKKTCPPYLTVDDLIEAEKKWIRFSQEECFPDELRLMEIGKPISKKSHIHPLTPGLQNGLLVLKGRTDLAKSLKEETKNPIILSPKSNYTNLLISHYHEQSRHFGVELVLNQLRQKFWIINGRAAVKKAFLKCQLCRNNKSKPKIPLMGQIPLVRLTREIKPFVNTGMDYFGPVLVTVGRRKEKRWGVIFTCLAVRAIHLEVAHTLNTDSTLMALKRFIARRGAPKTIVCDNGTNLQAAAKALGTEINEKQVLDSMTNKGIEVKFNPPGGAHFGGAWERLIGTIKKVIGKILYDQSIKDEVLLTLLAEAENIINSRPLTKVSTDPDDLEALTPNHFLLGDNKNSLFDSNPNPKCLRQDWKKSQMLSDLFWNRWVKEYLPSLTKRSKWTSDNKQIEAGDVVTIVDDNAPRYNWRLGKIESVYPGPDGRIRVVDVKTSTGLLRRPVSKLCKLEFEQ